jgi:hypothetical protein
MAAAGGLFAGLFWGRTLGQFARAMQADGEPVTLRGLVDLVTARPSRDAERRRRKRRARGYRIDLAAVKLPSIYRVFTVLPA